MPTFKGNVRGTNQKVRLSITENGISGFIQLENQKLYITNSIKFQLPNSKPTLFVVYYEQHIVDTNEFYCGVTLEEEKRFLETIPKPSTIRQDSHNCNFLKIATDADFAFYQINSNSTNAEILGIINLIEDVYVDTFNVYLRVTFQHVWETEDPYTGNPLTNHGAELLLSELRGYWQTHFQNVSRDIVHLFTGVNAYDPGVAGIAYVGTICNNPSCSFSLTRERFQAFLTTAHEIGHNFSGIHSDGQNCGTSGASLMCQGAKQIPMYFSPASINRISNFINNYNACLNPNLFYNINGNTNLCTSEQYTVPSIIATDTSVWTVSPSNLVSISGNGNSRILTRSSIYSGTLTLKVDILFNCGTITLYKLIVVGTPSPYDGGTFNDGGSGINQQLSTFNEVFHRRVYISLSGPYYEFTWDGLYKNGNVTWHHPVETDGLIIDFGNPLPVFNGDYVGFSIQRTNICGSASEPVFF